MIGEHPALFVELLHCLEAGLELRRRIHVGCYIAGLTINLGKRGAAEPVAARAQVDQHQNGVQIRCQLRSQRLAHIQAGREGRHDQRQRRNHFLLPATLLPARAHGHRILADGDADAQRRTQLHGHRPDRVEQDCVLTGIAGRRHPVRRKFYASYIFDPRRGDIREGLADRHAARCRTVDHGQRRALAHREGFAAIGLESHQRDGYIGDGHLPRTDKRIARAKPPHGTVTDRNQESLVRHRRKAQHPQRRFLQLDSGQIECRQLACAVLHVARHFRRLAEKDAKIHVHRIVTEQRVFDFEPIVVGSLADHGIRAALTFAQGLEDFKAVGGDRHYVTLLGFVAPDLRRRHARLFRGNRAQIDAAAAVRTMDQFRQRIREASRAHVVNGQDRVGVAHRPAAVYHLLGAALDFGIAALDRIEIQVGDVRAGIHA